MAPSTRAQNAILAGLAALAVGTSAYAVWTVRQPHPSLVQGGDGSVSPVVVPQAPKDDQETATATAPADNASTTTAPPAETEEPPAETEEAAVADWVEQWQGDDAHLLVVGDGYSNLPSQWVQEWGVLLGQDRPVAIHHWGEALDVVFNDPIVLSETDGPELTIWSAARAGTTIADAAALDQLLDEIDEDLPVLVLVGPEDLHEPGVRDATLDWAEDNAERVSVLDLRGVGPGEPIAVEWAEAFAEALVGT